MGSAGATFDLLWPLLDITTTLDPKLIVGIPVRLDFLSEPDWRRRAHRSGRRTGAARNRGEPGRNGAFESDLGFIYYWWLRDYPNAAAAYLEGSKNPQAPPWLKMMAARVEEKGGSLDTSRMIWSEIFSSSKDPRIRQRALEMLSGLKAQQDEMYLDNLAETYRNRFGRYPSTTTELRDAGLLGGVPVDPEGYPYILGPDGKSRLNPNSPVVIPPPPKTRPAKLK